MTSLLTSIKKPIALSLIVCTFGFTNLFGMSQKDPVEDGTRRIRLYNTHNMQYLDITYFKNGIYQQSALNRINNLFIDRVSNEIFKINPTLLDVLLKIQVEANIDKPLYIVTGYKHQKSPKKAYYDGESDAEFVSHSHGKGVDFYIKDFPLDQLRTIALKFEPKTVKYYPKLGYIHVDVNALSKVDPSLLTDTTTPTVSPISSTEDHAPLFETAETPTQP